MRTPLIVVVFRAVIWVGAVLLVLAMLRACLGGERISKTEPRLPPALVRAPAAPTSPGRFVACDWLPDIPTTFQNFGDEQSPEYGCINPTKILSEHNHRHNSITYNVSRHGADGPLKLELSIFVGDPPEAGRAKKLMAADARTLLQKLGAERLAPDVERAIAAARAGAWKSDKADLSLEKEDGVVRQGGARSYELTFTAELLSTP